ncbi:hypothetical protein HMPREF1554_02096 [Porphyromonas gingivalis F0569]|nr:hypothetical protein HMPREF1554_02096 [Porphyromonas gingivalis F0569]
MFHMKVRIRRLPPCSGLFLFKKSGKNGLGYNRVECLSLQSGLAGQ